MTLFWLFEYLDMFSATSSTFEGSMTDNFIWTKTHDKSTGFLFSLLAR